ncbi:MAG: extradiol dioxygenase [Acidobacteria bacterium]|nr:extradiol dioxygenase [Acidobacteriota bacterium]MYA47456.1 extradiol dioxygenase [Acidobacteriota bacterium]MYB32519.1 extradiol dioxygenase [Acidobacteriota bacterium]MYH21171.1 extradiol dioxygenase [Acidobacteriota bacterium]MYI39475.1 extradiol dioxygenase [Acidobacteriota bacterium]
MITGAHIIISSTDPEADRAFLRDVFGFRHLDLGDGWLVFALPPSEVAVHPAGRNDVHELYLLVEDVDALVRDLAARGVECDDPRHLDWGRLTAVPLPGGGRLPVYQPLHEVVAGS